MRLVTYLESKPAGAQPGVLPVEPHSLCSPISTPSKEHRTKVSRIYVPRLFVTSTTLAFQLPPWKASYKIHSKWWVKKQSREDRHRHAVISASPCCINYCCTQAVIKQVCLTKALYSIICQVHALPWVGDGRHLAAVEFSQGIWSWPATFSSNT